MGKLSRNSVASQIWDKFVGASRDTLPHVHLPTNQVVLQRYRGLHTVCGAAGNQVSKSENIAETW